MTNRRNEGPDGDDSEKWWESIPGLCEAVERLHTVAAVARHLGIKVQSMRDWHRNGVPPERAQKISEITGLPLHQIRPDIFPEEAGSAEQERATA